MSDKIIIILSSFSAIAIALGCLALYLRMKAVEFQIEVEKIRTERARISERYICKIVESLNNFSKDSSNFFDINEMLKIIKKH